MLEKLSSDFNMLKELIEIIKGTIKRV